MANHAVAPMIMLAAALLSGSGAAPAAAVPESLSIGYNLYFNGAHVAVMSEVFEVRGDRYRIVSETIPVGLAALFQKPARIESSGAITPEGLRPDLFEGTRVGGGQVRAEFDWDGAHLRYGRDGQTDTVGLPDGTQDRLSAMYQFMYRRPGTEKPFEVYMTDGRRLTHYRYDVATTAEIHTPLGRESAVHLTRQSEGDGSGNEIWLAPGHHFLPVRMLIREASGARYEQVATRVEFRGR